MVIYINYWFYVILSFGILNCVELLGMKRSSAMNFKTYNSSEIKTATINLLDCWIELSTTMLDAKIRELASQQLGTNEMQLDEAGAHVQHMAEQDAESFEYHSDCGLVRAFVAGHLNGVLQNPKYQISATAFRDRIKARYTVEEEDLEAFNHDNYYTLEQLLLVIVSMVVEDLNLEISSEHFIHITKQIIVLSISQRFLLLNEQLSWCNCENVTIGERVVLIIMNLEKLYKNFSPKECTAENPLIYTSFGSGALLFDYITIYIFQCFGYLYFDMSFIDHFYKRNDHVNYIKMAKKPLGFQLGFCAGSCDCKFFETIDSYLASAPKKNHLLCAVDILQFDKTASQFKTLIKKTADYKTIVCSLNNNRIRYSYNAQLKALV